jgi:hypothetical protein
LNLKNRIIFEKRAFFLADTVQLKMRMTHSSVKEDVWSSQQAVCCYLGPHEEEDKEESNTDSQSDEDEDEDGRGQY